MYRSEIGGEESTQLTPIGKSVSVSFRVRVVRACVRACEAVWVREGGAPQRWGLERGEIRLRRGLVPGSVCCYTRGF